MNRQDRYPPITSMATKRSLFSKPAWASKPTSNTKVSRDESDESLTIFGRNDVYQDIVELEKKKREKKEARQREKEAAAAQKKQEYEQQRKALRHENSREVKRRRISTASTDEDEKGGESLSDAGSTKGNSDVNDDGNDSNSPVRKNAGVSTETRNEEQPSLKKADPRTRNVQSIRQTRSSKRSPSAGRDDAPINLDSDESDQAEVGRARRNAAEDYESDETRGTKKANVRNPRSRRKATEPDPQSEEEDDPYLRDLKRRAREEAKVKQRRQVFASTTDKQGTPHVTAGGLLSPTSAHDSQTPQLQQTRSREEAATTPIPDTESDPEIGIRITTIIPGAQEIIVRRRASQPLDTVKRYWCAHNDVGPVLASKVFFTWNNNRLYDSTTMRGILDRLKVRYPDKDHGNRIEIEAMTDEIFEHRAKQRARRLAELENHGRSQSPSADVSSSTVGNIAESAGGGGRGGEEAPQKDNSESIVIKLVAQGIEEMRLRVRPNTSMGKIISGFKRMREIDPSNDVWLVMDGTRLEGDMTVGDAEFEDEDTIEVHIR